MDRRRTRVPAGRRWPVAGLGLAVLAAGVLLLLLRAPAPPQALPPRPATPAVPEPTWPAESGTLLVISSRADPRTPAAQTTQLTAIQLATGTHLTAPGIYAIVAAPDGSRWFGLRDHGGQSSVIALDPQSAAPLWATPISQTLRYDQGNGPSALGLAPDGSRLYVLSHDGLLKQWLQVVDTTNGALAAASIPLLGMDTCGGVRLAAPPSGSLLYLKCPSFVPTVHSISDKLDGVPFREPTKHIFLLNPSSIYGLIDGPRLVVFDLINYTYNSNPNSFRRLADRADQLLAIAPGLIELSGDRRFLVVGAVTTTTELRVYDTNTWQETARISYPRPIRPNTLAVSADGSRIYAVTAQAGGGFQPSEIMLEFPNLFPGDRNRFVLTAAGELAVVDTVQRPAPSRLADSIVVFDGATGAARAEYRRPGEDITRIVMVP